MLLIQSLSEAPASLIVTNLCPRCSASADGLGKEDGSSALVLVSHMERPRRSCWPLVSDWQALEVVVIWRVNQSMEEISLFFSFPFLPPSLLPSL